MGIYITDEEAAGFKKALREMNAAYSDEGRRDWFDADDTARAIADELGKIIEERGAACPANQGAPFRERMDARYHLTPVENEQYQRLIRKRAYWDLIAAVKKSGRDAEIQLDEERIEKIIEDYLRRRYSDWAVLDEAEDMRDAVQHVTGVAL